MSDVEFTFEMVINTCFGGFGLSQAASEEIFKRKGIEYDLEEIGSRVYPLAHGRRTVDEIIARNDLDLIAVVRELGRAANGDCADLKIVTVTVSVSVSDFDGKEKIAAVLGSVA